MRRTIKPGIWYAGNPVPAYVSPTPTPTPSPPTNSVLPVISGSLVVGGTLSCTTGTWANSPTSYLYQWISGGVYVGVNANTYTTITGDIGKNIFCEVTAVSAYGSLQVSSNVLGPITVVAVRGLKFNVITNSQYIPLVAV